MWRMPDPGQAWLMSTERPTIADEDDLWCNRKAGDIIAPLGTITVLLPTDFMPDFPSGEIREMKFHEDLWGVAKDLPSYNKRTWMNPEGRMTKTLHQLVQMHGRFYTIGEEVWCETGCDSWRIGPDETVFTRRTYEPNVSPPAEFEAPSEMKYVPDRIGGVEATEGGLEYSNSPQVVVPQQSLQAESRAGAPSEEKSPLEAAKETAPLPEVEPHKGRRKKG